MEFTGERFVPSSSLLQSEIGYEHLHRYHAVLDCVKDKVVLDIACGEGYGSALMAGYARKVYGVDIDVACIEHATVKYAVRNERVEFRVGQADAIPLPDASIDIAVSFETIEHLDLQIQQAFLTEIKRVLKQKGIFIISTPDSTNYSQRYNYSNAFHIKEFEKEEFFNFLEQYFPNILRYSQGYELISAITADKPEHTAPLRVLDWKHSSEAFQRKYLIAVCGREPWDSPPALSSAVFQVDKTYFELTDRLAALENAVAELGGWGRKLDSVIAERDQTINTLQAQNNGLRESVQKELDDRQNIIQEQKQKIHQLYHEVEQLNGRLREIYDSEGWKMLKIYYNFKGAVLPEHSKRYKRLKSLFNRIRGKKDTYQDAVALTGKRQPEQKRIRPAGNGMIEFPMFEAPTVTIVLPVYNQWDLTFNCLSSIKENTLGVSYEVIIADDASTDGTTNINNQVRNVVVKRNQKNLGFLLNCNHAAADARGKYVLFLNNDTEVMPGWLSALVDLMERDPGIGLAGSKLIYPDGRLQEAGAIIWKDASGWNFGHKQDPTAPEFNYVKQVDYVSGASILIRTELWKAIGGFDARYTPAYSEDSDLAFEVRKRGYKVVYQPLSEVVHYESYSYGNDGETGDKMGTREYQQANASRFYEKWKDVLEREHFPNGQKVFWARDKSFGRKTILVIDHYVPHFDKDAGSRTTFQLLQLFTELDYNVKFIGDDFYKYEPYTTMLQQMGIEVLYGPWYRDNWKQWIIDNREMIDYVYLNRPHISIKYIDFIKKETRAKLVYYGHDLHFIREQRQYEVERDPELLNSAALWKKTEQHLLENVDTVLTLSLKEKKIIESEFKVKEVCTMPAFFYSEFKPPVSDFSKRKDVLFVGGFAHRPNVDAVLWFVKEVWPMVNDELVNLIVVGSRVPAEVAALASSRMQIKGFVSDEELEAIYASVRLVVIPLRFGAGVKGKTVEAMYHGIPIVSTSFGTEGLKDIDTVVQPVDTALEFATRIRNLYYDEEKLAVLSFKEIEYTKQYFSKASVKTLMKQIFND